MNQKELKELIEFLVEKDIAEFELERGDVKVRIKRGADAVMSVVPTPIASAPPAISPQPATSANAPSQAAEKAEREGVHDVKSPIVGTFYEAPSPGSPPFVKVGDTVEAGQILCIVEAMKLMNEIESDVAGEILKKLVSNGQPVEYGQPLFAIKPK
jgi:acetyl-CoA carboxylase biotin carboxyl carrier protein